MAVTVINRECGDVILESLNLAGDVPATMTWHYGADTNHIEDKPGTVYYVEIKNVRLPAGASIR